MKISWGWKITLVYGSFVVMIVGLVAASSRQKVDLVSKDYYKDEMAYQAVLDAGKNQAELAGNFNIHANSNDVIIEFPSEFDKKIISGSTTFYSAVNNDWDKNININTTDNKMIVPRADLRHTVYQLKISYTVDGKKYYYQTQLDLHTS